MCLLLLDNRKHDFPWPHSQSELPGSSQVKNWAGSLRWGLSMATPSGQDFVSLFPPVLLRARAKFSAVPKVWGVGLVLLHLYSKSLDLV